jgi:predicted metal-dependent phosphoesterase TrpH
MIKAAIKKGLSGLAITDHNNVKGSLVAEKVAKKYKNFKIITGAEIRTTSGEIIGLGIKKNIPILLNLDEAIEKIHDLGGIAVAPHPFGKYFFRKCIGENAIKADAIEIFNATLTKAANKKATNLAKKFKKHITAGSDAHSINEIGNAGIICGSNPLEDIIKNKVKIFGKKTPLIDIAYLISMKFARSVEWRLSKTRKNYI